MIHRITPGDIIVTDNVAIEVGEDSQWEWSMGDRDKLVVRGRFLSNEELSDLLDSLPGA